MNTSKKLSEKEIKKHLQIDALVRVFGNIDSTNNEAKRLAEGGFFSPALILAEEQSAGRGRLGRSFYSPESTGLYFTVIIPVNFPLEDITLITPAAAVAVHRTLSQFTDKKLFIKWVNDIYCEDKKICGILAEALSSTETGIIRAVAVGIGINLSTKDFPKDISSVASSLALENADRNHIAAGIANELFAFTENLSAREFIPEYRKYSYVTGKEIFFIQGEKTTNARVLDIDDDGGLVVLLENGETTTLRGGEISVRIKKAPSGSELSALAD